MTYKIYCLKDPRTLEIRYIGVTTNTLGQRLSQHIHDSKKREFTHKSKWINELRKLELKPSIDLVETCTNNNWEDREKYWISKISNLTNTHLGGKGIVINRKYSSIERSIRAKYKSIIQLSKTGKFINKFESISIATKSLGLKSQSSICNILHHSGLGVLSKDCLWVYEKDYLSNNYIIPKIKTITKKVLYIDSNNQHIIFESATKAAKYLNFCPSYVSRICSKKRNSNLKLSYLNNEDIV